MAKHGAQPGVQYGHAARPGGRNKETNMADIYLNNSCPRRDFLGAWRNGKTCCPTCFGERPAIYSPNGLQQHYRMVHKDIEFNDITVKEGVAVLRGFVVSETRQNLAILCEERIKSVSAGLWVFLYRPWY